MCRELVICLLVLITNVIYTQGQYIVEVPGGPTFLLLPESSDDTFDPTGIIMRKLTEYLYEKDPLNYY